MGGQLIAPEWKVYGVISKVFHMSVACNYCRANGHVQWRRLERRTIEWDVPSLWSFIFGEASPVLWMIGKAEHTLFTHPCWLRHWSYINNWMKWTTDRPMRDEISAVNPGNVINGCFKALKASKHQSIDSKMWLVAPTWAPLTYVYSMLVTCFQFGEKTNILLTWLAVYEKNLEYN